ncbi:hypothetical protein DYB30_006889 [Aphanomyces astaci]|nr:hypothetical protein DYB30_006889 [Aphanomyces astaci]RHZ16578.1 hypothetical protein DYB26_009208 [Aphanomyces astaci]
MAGTTSTILQAILFVSPQFYCYPWKPLLNAAIGDTYDVALKHFLVNHKTAPNLVLHCVCMAVQLLGNFCFLQTVDDILFPSRPRPFFGFFGSVLQSVSHLVTKEVPTMVALQTVASPADKVRYEYAHVTFFPHLVFHGLVFSSDLVNKSSKTT